MALPKSRERAKAAFDALVLDSDGLALGFPAPRILGESPSIKEVRDTIRKLGEVDSPVLITGETGTGKELVARAIHALSSRAKGPFQAVNCATLPTPLFESELFGHLHGAFTGTVGERPGLLQSSGGGTLLLDEIGE